jgi:protoporphyrin/coproporphyrin ferrochelatase
MPRVILADYGGPTKLEKVKPFLLRLFNDPMIINAPWFVRPFIAKKIVKNRLSKSISIYRKLGGKSPLNAHVRSLVNALNKRQSDIDFEYGFSYTEPLLKTQARSYPDLIFPLFPHYSYSTYTSMERISKGVPFIPAYYKIEAFVDLLMKKMRQNLVFLDPDKRGILFVAHSIPVSFVEKGDPYVSQVKSEVEELQSIFRNETTQLVFQSPVGPMEWVGPFVDEGLRSLASKGKSEVLVVPLSFTMDNSETCYDLDMDWKEKSKDFGVKKWLRLPCFNNDPEWQKVIVDLVKQELALLEVS